MTIVRLPFLSSMLAFTLIATLVLHPLRPVFAQEHGQMAESVAAIKKALAAKQFASSAANASMEALQIAVAAIGKVVAHTKEEEVAQYVKEAEAHLQTVKSTAEYARTHFQRTISDDCISLLREQVILEDWGKDDLAVVANVLAAQSNVSLPEFQSDETLRAFVLRFSNNGKWTAHLLVAVHESTTVPNGLPNGCEDISAIVDAAVPLVEAEYVLEKALAIVPSVISLAIVTANPHIKAAATPIDTMLSEIKVLLGNDEGNGETGSVDQALGGERTILSGNMSNEVRVSSLTGHDRHILSGLSVKFTGAWPSFTFMKADETSSFTLDFSKARQSDGNKLGSLVNDFNNDIRVASVSFAPNKVTIHLTRKSGRVQRYHGKPSSEGLSSDSWLFTADEVLAN